MASLGSKSPTSRYTTSWAFGVYRLLLCRLAVTTNASGTLGSGTCVQPCGIGRVRSRALKSFACCGSSLTFLLAKNSRSVPELAGVSSGGAATGGAATGGAGGSPCAAGASAGEIGTGAAAAVPGIGLPTAPGTTATACGIGAAGAGLGRGGNTGSADAVGLARPKTPAAPTARPATVTRQLRAVCFMGVGPSEIARLVVEVAESDCNQGEAAASSTGIDLQHTWDNPLTGLQSNRDRRWSAGRSTPPL